jgi:hypothetical protein
MAMCSHLALFLAQAPSFVTSKRARLPGHVGNRKSRASKPFSDGPKRGRGLRPAARPEAGDRPSTLVGSAGNGMRDDYLDT